MKCQKPPVKDWLNVAVIYCIGWFLSMLVNFPHAKKGLAFGPNLQPPRKFTTFYRGSFINTASGIFNFTNSMFSLIVVYFIYLFANEKGWALLAFVSKIYLIAIVGVFAILFIAILTAFLFSISAWLSLVFRR